MQYSSAPAGRGVASSGPSRIWYWFGGGIILVGVLAAALWVVVGIGALSDEIDGFQRVPLGSSGEVSFSEPGGYVIYYEGEQGASPDFSADLQPLDGGTAEVPKDYRSKLTYNLGGRAGSAVGTIRIIQPGRFRLHTTTTSTAGGELAVGPTIGRKLVFLVIGGLALAFGSCIIGAAAVLVTAVKRHSARGRR